MHRGSAIARVRRAVVSDADTIASVLEGSFAEFKHFYTVPAYAATVIPAEVILQRIEEGPVWLALEGQAAVGTLSAMLTDTGLYLRSMAVVPAARGRRLGKGLLRRAEEFARREDQERLYLSSAPFLADAIRVYERFGLRTVDQGPWDLFGTPLLTMEKWLRCF